MMTALLLRIRNNVFSISMLVSLFFSLSYFGVRVLNWDIYWFVKNGSTSQETMNIINNLVNCGYNLFAPIFIVIVTGLNFCNDYNDGYIKNILVRMSRNRYCINSIIVSSLVGGLTIVIPELIVFLIAFWVGIDYDMEYLQHLIDYYDGEFYTGFDHTVFGELQYIDNGIWVVVVLLIIGFIFGAIVSNFSLMVSAILPNKYFALSFPFIFYYTIFILFYRIGDLVYYSPVNMLGALLMPSFTFVVTYNITVFLLVAIGTFYFLKRRLKHV